MSVRPTVTRSVDKGCLDTSKGCTFRQSMALAVLPTPSVVNIHL